MDQLAQDMAFLDRELIKLVCAHFGVRLAHDRASVARLDRLYTGPLREHARGDFQSASVMTAAYLGETVRTLVGGRWHLDETFGPCIVDVPGVDGLLRVLARAERRIRGGEPEGLSAFLAKACPLRS